MFPVFSLLYLAVFLLLHVAVFVFCCCMLLCLIVLFDDNKIRLYDNIDKIVCTEIVVGNFVGGHFKSKQIRDPSLAKLNVIMSWNFIIQAKNSAQKN